MGAVDGEEDGEHVTPCQFGLLGEPRVNVLEPNRTLHELKQR
ncbi:MAG TPA: hypothetical protein VHY48_09830 [Acidobacteriaceae bacterium]|nr:hypothetical protein [Acidobacteriaceae bacterium]